MNDTQLLEQFAATDAYAPDTPLPVVARSRAAALAEIERRAGMQTHTRTEPETPRRRARDGWLAAAAAFVVVLIVGAVMVFWGAQGNEDVVEQTTTTSVPTTVTTIPPPPEAVPPIVDAWQRVGATAMGPFVGLYDMTQFEHRLVAVGFDPETDNRRLDGVIYVSDDGITWSQLADDDPALTLGAVLMYAVTDGGPGLVAVGTGCEDEDQGCSPYATVWTSVDGATWTRSPYDASTFGDTATQTSAMVGVTDTSHGLIAVGAMEYWAIDDESVEELVTIHPTAWISADGVTWERAWEGTGSEMSPDDYYDVHLYMDSVVEGPDGQLVAVGAVLDEKGSSVAAVWTSTDGRAWERVESDESVFGPGTVMVDVTWGGNGFVAVGGVDTAVGIWRSPDGTSWTRIETNDQQFDTVASLTSVASLDSGYITVGPHEFLLGSSGIVTLWTSPDGAIWDQVLILDEGYSSEIVVVDGGIAVAGGMPNPRPGDSHAAVWVGPRFDPHSPPLEPMLPKAPPEEEPAVRRTAVGELIQGITCEELAADGYSYPEVVSYWARYDMDEDFDLETDGSPCTGGYPEADVLAVFGEPAADSMVLVGSYSTGSFAIIGPAIDAGIMCAEGTFGDTENIDFTNPALLWRWEDIYTCNDNSGTFTFGIDEYIHIVELDDDGDTVYGVWDIVSGTGDYEALRGGGVTKLDGDVKHTSIGRLWFDTNEN